MLRLCLSRCRVQKLSKNNTKILGISLIDCFYKKLDKQQYSTGWKYEGPEKTQNIIDEKNIFYSPWKDLDLNEGLSLHELVWKDVDKWWDKTALICSVTGRSYTFGQLKRLSGRFATSLRKLNIKPGSSIAVVLPNIPEFAIVAMGASEAGIPLALINPAYTAREINYQLENSEAEAVVTVPSRYSTVAESISGIAAMQRHPVIVVEDGSDPAPPGTIKFKDFVADDVMEFEKTGENIKIVVVNDTVILPYSSGTTGLPKGVELTHRNVVANLSQTDHKDITCLQPAIGEKQDILPAILPFYHSWGFSILWAVLRFGNKVICMPTFTANNFLDVFERFPITSLLLVPPIFQLMVYDSRFTKKHIKNMKIMVNGAGSLDSETVEKLREKFGNTFGFNQGYGLTEASPSVTSAINRGGDSVGFLLPNSQAKIVGQSADNLGKNLGFNQVGEILVKGPHVMKGYFKNPQATADTMEGEWLKTGDLGSFNDEGDLRISGRLKELIKVNAMQVSPVELEEILRRHEKIADAAVIGVPHERFGEIPKAFVVIKKDMEIKEDDIKEYVAQHVVNYKQLGHVQFINQIPKSSIGKILRKELQKI